MASVLLAGLVMGIVALPAEARVMEKMTFKRTMGKISRTYPATQDTRPFLTPGVWDYDECTGDVDYCHVVPIEYDHEGRLNNAVVTFSMTYPDSFEYQANVYEFNEAGQEVQISALQKKTSAKAGTVLMASDHVDLEAGPYAIALKCDSGCGPGEYTISIEYSAGEIYKPPTKYTPPAPQPTASSTAAAGPSPTASSSTDPPRPVAKAGQDGPATPTTIQGIAAGQQASPPSTRGTTITNIVLLVLLTLVLSIGGTMVTMKIRRDLQLKG